MEGKVDLRRALETGIGKGKERKVKGEGRDGKCDARQKR